MKRLARRLAAYAPRQQPGSLAHTKVPTSPRSGGHLKVSTTPGPGGHLEVSTTPGSGGHLKFSTTPGSGGHLKVSTTPGSGFWGREVPKKIACSAGVGAWTCSRRRGRGGCSACLEFRACVWGLVSRGVAPPYPWGPPGMVEPIGVYFAHLLQFRRWFAVTKCQFSGLGRIFGIPRKASSGSRSLPSVFRSLGFFVFLSVPS
jgi:hypothetical protein